MCFVRLWIIFKIIECVCGIREGRFQHLANLAFPSTQSKNFHLLLLVYRTFMWSKTLAYEYFKIGLVQIFKSFFYMVTLYDL
jgi:hypothetical protein